MAWFDFLGDIDWGDVLKVAVPVAGTYLTTRANNEAAQNVMQANQQAQQGVAQSNETAAQLLREQQARAEQILRPSVQATAPALDYLRTVMAQGDRMAPWQQAELRQRTEDFGRQAQRKFNSGRAFTAMADRFYGDNERSMQASNQQRADTAARQLGGDNLSLQRTLASGQAALGSPLAALSADTGASYSRLAQDTGQTAGYANQANAQAYSGGLNDIFGAIRGFVTSDQKERKSAYA